MNVFLTHSRILLTKMISAWLRWVFGRQYENHKKHDDGSRDGQVCVFLDEENFSKKKCVGDMVYKSGPDTESDS